tara:strand:+ start:1420 stop:2409 length:990 start_codon:yes stop_codon:yes gene_type:complete
MIFKSYLAENDSNFFSKNGSMLFFGENLGLRNDFRKRILLLQKVKIIRRSQDEILRETDNFFEEVLNVSLFDEKKIFIIENVNDKTLEIFKEIESRLDENKIFFFADALDKKSKLRAYFEKSKELISIPCYQDNILSLKKIIQSKLSNFDNLSNENINTIADNCSLDRDKLNNELEKIKLYFTDSKIDTEKLKILLNLRVNDNFNDIRDEAINGNKIKTNKLLSHTILEDDKYIFYLNMLNQRLNKLGEILKSNKNSSLNKLIDDVRPPIFWRDKPVFLEQLKKWNLKKINKILNKSYNLEVRLKSKATINNNLLIKMLLVDICQLANS